MMRTCIHPTGLATSRPSVSIKISSARLISKPNEQAIRVFCQASSEESNVSADFPQAFSRRAALACLTGSAVLLQAQSESAQAVGFEKQLKKRKIPDEKYSVAEITGLKYFDLQEGQGPVVKAGDRVRVHYDCIYRGIDVVSSRAARLLGGNRTIAEPFEFVVGEQVFGVQVKKINDGANGMFAGQGGPKPPQALSLSVMGMKRGGKRTLVVDKPDLGYGLKGIGEMPANATFELKVEVLDVFPPA